MEPGLWTGFPGVDSTIPSGLLREAYGAHAKRILPAIGSATAGGRVPSFRGLSVAASLLATHDVHSREQARSTFGCIDTA